MQTKIKKQTPEKVWIALFFGYNGSSYNGMQHQKQQNIVSVENELLPLLFKAGFLSTKNYTQLQRKQKYSRAARTDSGVHACINGISCNFSISKQFFDNENTLDKKKLHLAFKEAFQQSKYLKYHCFKKVTTRFQMRQLVFWRRYSYICPFDYFQEKDSKLSMEQTLAKLKDCCKQFIGTHNFHNYSKGLNAKDAEAQRYILDFQVECLTRQKRFVQFVVTGQSFVYHQIRKMVGSIAFIFVNKYPAQFISNTFFRNQFYLPIAPAQGLYLKEVNFQGYNKKNEIPEKIEFQEDYIKTSIGQLEQEIVDFVCLTEQNIWEQWLTALRQGKTLMPGQEKEKPQQIPLKGQYD